MNVTTKESCLRVLHVITPVITIVTALIMAGFFAVDARMQAVAEPIRTDIAILEQRVVANNERALDAVKNATAKVDRLEAKIDWLVQRELENRPR